MLNSFKLNTAFFLAKQFQKIAKAQKELLVIGGLITPIAMAFGVNPYGVEQLRRSSRLDLESWVATKMVVREGDIYCLTFRSSHFTLPLLNQ